MTINGSHPNARSGSTHDDGDARRICIPLIPTLLGALAVMNIASVIMVLIE